MRLWKTFFILLLAIAMLNMIALTSFASGYTEEDILHIVNEKRLANGLQPLVMDKELLLVSRVRAKEASKLFAHIRPDGRSAKSAMENIACSRYGENLAISQGNDAKSVVQKWMDSVYHRENVLGRHYTKIGIACVQGADGLYYWAQEFSCD